MKKTWHTPELVILFRGRPEEAVLCNCKHQNTAAVAPHSYRDSCNISADVLQRLPEHVRGQLSGPPAA